MKIIRQMFPILIIAVVMINFVVVISLLCLFIFGFWFIATHSPQMAEKVPDAIKNIVTLLMPVSILLAWSLKYQRDHLILLLVALKQVDSSALQLIKGNGAFFSTLKEWGRNRAIGEPSNIPKRMREAAQHPISHPLPSNGQPPAKKRIARKRTTVRPPKTPLSPDTTSPTKHV